MEEKLLLGFKAATWALAGGALGLVVDPSIIQGAAEAGGDLTLPPVVGGSIYTALLALLVWALRRSDSERVAEAKEFAERLNTIHSSGKSEIAQMRSENSQLVMTLLEYVLRKERSDGRR